MTAPDKTCPMYRHGSILLRRAGWQAVEHTHDDQTWQVWQHPTHGLGFTFVAALRLEGYFGAYAQPERTVSLS